MVLGIERLDQEIEDVGSNLGHVEVVLWNLLFFFHARTLSLSLTDGDSSTIR